MVSETGNVPELLSLSRFQRSLGLLIFSALAILLAFKLLKTAACLQQPDEMCFVEATGVYIARRVQDGGMLFGDWRERPHVVTWYGPLTYLLPAYIGRLIDADAHRLYMIGRYISLISTIGTGALIISLLRWWCRVNLAISVAMGLAYVTADAVFRNVDMTFRPDAPVCFLTMLGVGLALRSDKSRFFYASALVFLLAFLYKQSSIAGPLAVVAWTVANGERRSGVYYGALCAVLFVGSALLLNAATDGRYFLNNVVALKGNTRFHLVPYWVSQASKAIGPLLAVAFLAVALEWVRRKWDLVTILFAVSYVLTAAATYRDGSWISYFMLPLAVGCVVAGRQLGEWWRFRSTVPVAGAALTFAFILGTMDYVPDAAISVMRRGVYWNNLKCRHATHWRQCEGYQILAHYLNGLSGPVLTDLTSLALWCPHCVMLDTFGFTTMADAGNFDDGELIEDIQRGKLAAIVLTKRSLHRRQITDSFSRRWRDAMKEKYRPVDVVPVKSVLVYRPVAKLPDRSMRRLGP